MGAKGLGPLPKSEKEGLGAEGAAATGAAGLGLEAVENLKPLPPPLLLLGLVALAASAARRSRMPRSALADETVSRVELKDSSRDVEPVRDSVIFLSSCECNSECNIECSSQLTRSLQGGSGVANNWQLPWHQHQSGGVGSLLHEAMGVSDTAQSSSHVMTD